MASSTMQHYDSKDNDNDDDNNNNIQTSSKEINAENNAIGTFPFCHPMIAEILDGPNQRKEQIMEILLLLSTKHTNIEDELLKQAIQKFDNVTLSDNNNYDTTTTDNNAQENVVSIHDLIDLAILCDHVLFVSVSQNKSDDYFDKNENDNVNRPSLGLFIDALIEEIKQQQQQQQQQQQNDCDDNDMTDNASLITVTTLLALNALESAIRYATVDTDQSKKETGSPLFKDMIFKLRCKNCTSSSSSLSSLTNICELLFLPQHGLNLRNLIWHGFVSQVPRSWFSLVVIITKEILKMIPFNEIVLHQQRHDKVDFHDDDDDGSDTILLDLWKYSEFENVLLNVNSLPTNATIPDNSMLSSESTSLIHSWLLDVTSPSYVNLWHLAYTWITSHSDDGSDTVIGSNDTMSKSILYRPATVCAVLSVVLEHVLRIEWCRANNREEDMQARPGVFYVTLDGFGQRHVHDLILHPYVIRNDSTERYKDNTMSPELRNNLIWDFVQDDNHALLNGSIVALLTDLFCSPSGPNIRASIAHGLWNSHLFREWTPVGEEIKLQCERQSNQKLMNYVQLILMTFDSIARRHEEITSAKRYGILSEKRDNYFIENYRPVFTYAQETRRYILRVQHALNYLVEIMRNESCDDARQISRYKKYLHVAKTTIPKLLREDVVLSTFHCSDLYQLQQIISYNEITEYHGHDMESTVLHELELNQQLAQLAATRALLSEIADAAEAHVHRLRDALYLLDEEYSQDIMLFASSNLKRKRKASLRLLRANEMIYPLYCLAFAIALSSLKCDTRLFEFGRVKEGSVYPKTIDFKVSYHLIRRTRMVLSTTETFLTNNVDRAIKSIAEYVQSKQVQSVLSNIDTNAKK